MADSKEVRHAGIGLDFNINGLNEFKELNEAIDKMVSKGKEIRQQFGDLGSSFNGIKSGKSDIAGIRDSMQGVTDAVKAAKAPLKDVDNDIKQVASSARGAKRDIDLSSGFKSSRTAINGAYQEMNKYSESIKKLPVTKFTQVKKSTDEARKSTDKATESTEKSGTALERASKRASETSHLFGKVLGAHLVANGITNALASVQASFGQLKDAVVEYDGKQQTMNSTWDTLTGSAGKGRQMVNIGNNLAAAYNQNINIVDELNQSFYHVFDNAPRTKELTESVLTLGDTLNLSDENVTRLGTNFTHMLSSGKMQLGDFNMINDQLPMYAGKMLEFEKKQQNNSKLTMSELRKQMSAGKISAKDAEAVMNSLGAKYQKASENLMKTIPGMERSIKTQMPALLDAFYKPIATMKSPLIGQFTKWIQDKDTKDQFKLVGQALSMQFSRITKAFGGKKFNIGDSLNKGLINLASGIDHFGTGIVKNKKSIKDVMSLLKETGGISFKVLIQALKDLLPVLKLTGALAARFPKTFVGIGAAGLVAGKAVTTFSRSVSSASTAYKGISKAGGWAKSLSKGSRDAAAANKTMSRSQKVVSAAINGTKRAASGLGTGFTKLGSLIKRGAIGAFNGLKRAALSAGRGLKAVGLAMKANPWTIWVTAILAVVAALVALYKHNRKFRNFVNGLIKWSKNFARGIAKWFRQAYKDATKWITKLVKDVKKRWGNLWKDNIRIFKNAWNDIKDILRVFKDIFTGDFSDLKRAIPKLVRDLWKTVKSEFKGTYDFLDDLTGGWISRITKAFSDAWKSIGKGWKSFWNGIDDWFKNLWHGIASHASDGINDIIGVLNGGIKGIDWVISKFGGSSKAIGTISKVHLATGTGVFGNQRRAITRPTMAVLNDGHDSPETGNREILMHPNGLSELIKGVNVTRMLEPGAEVLNASEAKFAMGMDHFAGGTGFFGGIWKGAKNLASSAVSGTEKLASNAWSGIKSGASAIGGFASNAWKGATHLLSTIQKIISSPTKYLESLIKKPTGTGEILSDFAGGFYSSMKKQAKSWWSELWSMASGALDESGSSSSLLNAMKKYGEGHKYVWGAAGPTSFDCSGLVQYALEHAFGISYPRTSGAQIAKASRVSSANAKPGDLIGNGEHIGVYAGNGNYYSAMSETTHPNIGMSPVSTFPGTPQYGHVAGIKSDSDSKKAKAGGSSLQKLIKSETGGMLGWITKHLAPLLDTGDGGGPDGGSITHSMVNKALEIAHIPHGMWSKMQHDIIAVAKSETGNRNIMQQIHDVNSANGNPAGGPLQFTKTTFDAFAFPGHHNFRSSLDQTLAYLNNSDYASAAGNTVIWGTPKFDWLHSGPQGHKRYAKGGDVPANQLSIVGEKGWELFKPKSGGHVFDHETSKKILSRGSRNVEIHGATIQMTVNGNADNATVSKLQDALNQSNEALVEKMRETFGLNDEGGLII